MLIVLFIAGCAASKNFSYGVGQIGLLDSKYNTSIEKYPKSINEINQLINELSRLKNLKLASSQDQLDYVIEYRILNLEAEKLYIQSQKHGSLGTTKNGFGCKSRPLITESVELRNLSSLKGFEAVSLLREFISTYPNEASLAGLSEKNALFLNATFYQISKDAKRDSSIINHFCPANLTLDLYRAEIRKTTALSEEDINNLTYDKAVTIWKKNKGIQ